MHERAPSVKTSCCSTDSAFNYVNLANFSIIGALGDDVCFWFATYFPLLQFWVWYRYTLFIPLYPVGLLAEMVLMAKSLPYLKSQKLNSIALPNALNFGFDYHLFIQVTQPSMAAADYCSCCWLWLIFLQERSGCCVLCLDPHLHVLQGLLLVYPMLWLYLYRSLLSQRRKRLQPVKQD